MKTKVADIGTLADGKAHCVKVGNHSVVLVKTEGGVRAFENRCPHLNLPLARGRIDGEDIVCPFHGSRFNMKTGENTDWVSAVAGVKIPAWSSALLSFGKKPQPIRTFDVAVEGQDVFVDA